MATRISGEKQYQQQPKWTAFLTELLADLIVDHALKGNRVNNSISNKAWNCISDEFHTQSGLKWNQEHLKNRFSVLRRQYAVVKPLIAREDFIFNEANGSVIATAETWHQYVKEYPDAEAIRTGGCPIYKQLSQIFAEDPITSGNHERPVLLPQAKTEFSSEHDDHAAGVSPPTAPKRRRRSSSSSSGVEAAIANAISEMAAASKLRTTALTQQRSRFSLAECIRELDQIHGLPENVYFAALEFFNNPSARETFLSLKCNLRLAWLQWKSKAASHACIPGS